MIVPVSHRVAVSIYFAVSRQSEFLQFYILLSRFWMVIDVGNVPATTT